MTMDQGLIFAVLVLTVGLFLWGRWRHDAVAIAALLACVAFGLIPSGDAFAGFGHPAVITVAAVLVLSRGLQNAGVVDLMAARLLPRNAGRTVTIAALMALGGLLSAFMNNVGAMALLMPVAISVAGRHGLTPGQVLMPLAFGTILGGMATLIGTPPNLVVSAFRAELGGSGFGMFDFTPVGAGVAVIGIIFVALFGWRLVPPRKATDVESFETGKYLTEARVTEISKVRGKTVREAEAMLEDADAQIIRLVRDQHWLSAPRPGRVLRRGDILVIEAEPEALASVLSTLGLRLEEQVETEAETEEDEEQGKGTAEEERRDDSEAVAAQPEDDAETAAEEADAEEVKDSKPDSDEVVMRELVARPGSALIGRSASDIELRTRYSLNLLAVSRQGHHSIKRLRSTAIEAGDVLLMQGSPEAIASFSGDYACVPLAERVLGIADKRVTTIAAVIMAGAVGGAALGLVPAAMSFVAGVLAYMLLRVVPPRSLYDAIDWPVIILLGALIPVAGAMATTGAADLLASLLVQGVAQGNAVFALALILVVTMTLSDFMNNAATAAVMCPIAISTAATLSVSPDSFLMAVAIGASCAFLTPIGHQNNTLILGPGGFRFGDYWKLGLPMELLVIAVSLPLLLLVWPL
ncbi:MAG: SLC13 family permease [Gammaproteobacteria bacterium]|nr:SLC13 family permease [Gammaproteobacteria bacterium]